VSSDDLLRWQNELTDANIDWQMHIYGHTSHAFTNPDVHDKKAGLMYNPLADKRSWQSMENFFKEKFA
jgi:dienelactone hydrolase